MTPTFECQTTTPAYTTVANRQCHSPVARTRFASLVEAATTLLGKRSVEHKVRQREILASVVNFSHSTHRKVTTVKQSQLDLRSRHCCSYALPAAKSALQTNKSVLRIALALSLERIASQLRCSTDSKTSETVLVSMTLPALVGGHSKQAKPKTDCTPTPSRCQVLSCFMLFDLQNIFLQFIQVSCTTRILRSPFENCGNVSVLNIS